MLTRGFISSICAVAMLASCNRPSESQLVGTWRIEDDKAAEDLELHRDHTFTYWLQSKTEFHTPSVIIETGAWRLHDREVETEPKTTNSVEPGPKKKSRIVKLVGDTLILATGDGSRKMTFQRLPIPDCSTLLAWHDSPAIEANLIGTWQMHYRTHDYEQSFNGDGSTAVSGRIDGALEQIHSGSWRVDGNDVIMALKTERNGSLQEEGNLRWTITAMEPQCVVFKEEGIAYTLKRLK